VLRPHDLLLVERRRLARMLELAEAAIFDDVAEIEIRLVSTESSSIRVKVL
jgi:hypothetical protein